MEIDDTVKLLYKNFAEETYVPAKYNTTNRGFQAKETIADKTKVFGVYPIQQIIIPLKEMIRHKYKQIGVGDRT